MHDGSFLGLQGVHRAEITGIGPDGRAQVAYPHDASAEGIAADLRWLLSRDS